MSHVEVRLDLFPAVVVENYGTDHEVVHPECRLLVGLDEIWAWKMTDSGATLAVNERYEAVEGRRAHGWHATTGDGSRLHFRRATGCGCGNPLRGWQPPFPTVHGVSL